MKKIVSCMVVFIILVSAVGMAECENEILFRGLDWNTNAIDFLDAVLADSYPNFNDSMKARLISEDEYLDYFDSEAEFLTGRAQVSLIGACAYRVHVLSDDSFYAAGYPIDFVVAQAVSTVENARVMTGAENSRMVKSYYMLDHRRIDDMTAAYDDLYTKLTNLYGECDLVKIEYDGIHISNVWYGANDTYAMLHGQWHDGACVLIDISYGITNAEEILAQLENPKTTVNPNDTDGL